jgi:hypothetical protein
MKLPVKLKPDQHPTLPGGKLSPLEFQKSKRDPTDPARGHSTQTGQIHRGPASISVWVSQSQTFPLEFKKSKKKPHKCTFFPILAMKLPVKLKPGRHPSRWETFPLEI